MSFDELRNILSQILREMSEIASEPVEPAQNTETQETVEKSSKEAIFRKKFLNGIQNLKQVKIKTVLEDDELEELLFQRYLREQSRESGRPFNAMQKSRSYNAIPQFYFRLPESEVGAKCREEARSLFLTKKSKMLLTSDELKSLWTNLEKKSNITVGEDQFIDYMEYLNVRVLGGEKVEKYLTTSAFMRLVAISTNPPNINVVQLFNYVMRKVWIEQTRIGLSFYDSTGQGYLSEADLEQYILELIPTFSQLAGLEKSFHNFYVCTVLRKFFFFLDPLRTGKIRIRDILTSGFLDDLLELRDDEVSKDAQENNWFSATSALSVYGIYLNLDKDHNGMLSLKELAG